MTLWQQLSPRRHVAAAIAWAVFAVVTVAALIAANLAAAEAEHRAREDAEGLLAELATQVRDALSLSLETRRSVLQATAAQIDAAGKQDHTSDRRILDAVQRAFSEFIWLGIADPQGTIVADTSGTLAGALAASSPWFVQGRTRSFITEVHAPIPALAPAVDSATPGPMDFAVPLNASGGVLAASMSWPSVEGVLTKMRSALSKHRLLEVMVVSRNGMVLSGPAPWVGRRIAQEADLTESGRYVVGTRSQLRLAGGLGLGWTTIVRQSEAVALAEVRNTRRAVFLIVVLSGLLAAGAAAVATRLLTRRLSRLATQAEAVRAGEQHSLSPPEGHDDVSRIGATLVHLVGHLQSEKQALQVLNRSLDQRIAERTRQIERMADEARHAAVNRERLRIARDLHDTLAHSLMALLTQVRLVRKLHARMDGSELEDELGRAESVATSGLSEARAAIAQMRDNGVRETGLGMAMQDLAKRFEQRTGVAVPIDMHPDIASWADDRAEVVFRIIEEALRNVERHAQAGLVRILAGCDPVAPVHDGELEASTRVAHIEVSDDGQGFDPGAPTPGHFGIRGMHEQAALINAALTVQSGQGQGTRIILDFHV